MKLWIVGLDLNFTVEGPHWVQSSVGRRTAFFLYDNQSFSGMNPWYAVWFQFLLNKLEKPLAFFIQKNIFEDPQYYPNYNLVIKDFYFELRKIVCANDLLLF